MTNYIKKLHIPHIIQRFSHEIIIGIVALLFSSWLMIHTFSYANGSMLIGAKAWSDFANHIPLIRSFSLGWNFPPKEPMFSGEPIHYHFLFFLIVGLLEKFGMRIDWALNVPSILGFAGLMIILYMFARYVFDSKAVGILTVLFFIFNGSFSFLTFFTHHPLSATTVTDIVTNATFPSFAPYDKGVISAFWNLNIYTNQRHLAPSYALSLGILGFFLFHSFRNRKPEIRISIIVGVILGLSFFFHMAVFMITCIILFFFMLLYKQLRYPIFTTLFLAGIIVIPEFLYLKSGGTKGGLGITYSPGYLIQDSLSVPNFIYYWFMNLGFHSVLMFIGFWKAPRNIKKIFISVIPIFLLGNLFQFSPEMAANHKFFNYFMLFGSMFTAYALVVVWKKNVFAKHIVIIMTFFLILSGIIDFFPVYNDHYITLPDYPINPDIAWIKKNTPLNATFFNTNFLYDTANLAGRPIFLGWPYFAWSSGLDTNTRGIEIKNILETNNKRDVCNFMRAKRLDYISLTQPSEDFPYNPLFFKTNFHTLYTGNTIQLISVKDNCSL